MSDVVLNDADAAAGGSPVQRGAALRSVASVLPETIVTNAEMGAQIGKDEEWIFSRTGIRERRVAQEGERLTDLATAAGRAALAQAGVAAAELDLILVATMTPDEATPNTAPLVAHALGARRAGAIDIGAACTGYLSALALAAGQIETGRAEQVLLIGADAMSRIVDPSSKTAMLFADGAGATVMSATTGATRIGPVLLRADGEVPEYLIAYHHDRALQMDGHATFKHAVNRMTEVTREAVAAAELTLEQIDLFVYHQANARILRAVGERLGLDPERVVDCIERTGNTSSASIPHALDVARLDGRLRDGSRVLLSAFGAGFTWGGAVIEWGGPDA
ncbi:MAG: 3-oxoacyl-(acyl-carrier-protein) synthase [Conexibacter sp.]|jgi:3-oxoacyl-[acyl-carrier-protein] synthase-3|nr:3-oxoacyl-(acyl-carrier-protein) synthase [Conexibacter sp.]